MRIILILDVCLSVLTESKMCQKMEKNRKKKTEEINKVI